MKIENQNLAIGRQDCRQGLSLVTLKNRSRLPNIQVKVTKGKHFLDPPNNASVLFCQNLTISSEDRVHFSRY